MTEEIHSQEQHELEILDFIHAAPDSIREFPFPLASRASFVLIEIAHYETKLNKIYQSTIGTP